MSIAPTDDAPVGDGEIAARFYQGRYHEVLAATVDRAGPVAPRDLAFAVGALAFRGRLVEAELLARTAARAPSPRTRAAAAFFIAVAQSRGGRFDDAARTLRDALRATSGGRDPWCRALLLQGAACARYFAGRWSRALVDAEGAQRCALAAGFAYASMLANDLRGHALAAVRSVAEGVEALALAREQAERLGYDENARVIATSVALHRASAAPAAEALALLDVDGLAAPVQDAYTLRSFLVARAPWLAWAGRGGEARALLARAEPLCAAGDRPRALLALSRAHVARVCEGWDACDALLDDAAPWLDAAPDPVLRAELTALRGCAARARGDADGFAAAQRALAALARESGVTAARQWLAAWGIGRDAALPAPLAVAASRSARCALDRGLLGLLPESVGLRPGRRLHRFDDALVVEAAGDLVRLPALSPRSAALLGALGRGLTLRGELVEAAWGLRGARVERHAGALKTAVARLRQALGPARTWVLAHGDGYAMAPDVTVLDHAAPRATTPGTTAGAHGTRRRLLLARLGTERAASVGELARAVDIPQRTLVRELGALCADGFVVREGAGRATRYRLASSAT